VSHRKLVEIDVPNDMLCQPSARLTYECCDDGTIGEPVPLGELIGTEDRLSFGFGS
jgi:hypothetical protein